MLLKRNAKPNAQTRQGVTPLMVAARLGHAEVVRALLDKKADPNMPDFTGRTALTYAKQSGRAPSRRCCAGPADASDARRPAPRAAPIRISGTLAIDPAEIHESFVRAGGPGGQHVNTTSTAVQLRFDVRHSPSLPDDVRHGWSGWPAAG